MVSTASLPQEERRLAAIMFTDMVGYTSLSQRDETLALRLLQEHRKVVRPIISKYHGDEVKTMGDAFLVEFPNALDATKCAYEIQCTLHEFNLDRNGEQAVRVRIGIHIGDVVHRERDIYGDAVNLASRVEAIAEPGGIAVSGQVHDSVRNKVEFPLEYMGEQSLKNVEVPLEIYRVCLPWDSETVSGQRMLAKVSGVRATGPSAEAPSAGMVDRETERASLGSALDEVAATGRSKVIFIGGEAGIGKTRLLDWVVHEATSRYGAYVGKGYCLEDVSIPYFPFSEALSVFMRGRSADEGTRRVMNWLDRALGRTFAGGNADFERYQLYENVVKLVDAVSKDRVVLICLEDVHWSDTASLGLLHYFARNIRDSRVLVPCTYRTEELGQIAPGKPHYLSETMRLMRREGLIQVLDLAGLPFSALAELTGSLIPGASETILRAVAKESEGNPFYAIESTRYLIDTGAVEKVEGSWVTRNQPGQIEIPSAILDVIARRLSRLTQDERELLDCASVVGEHFNPILLSSALGIGELRCVQELTRLSRETRLVVEDDIGFRFDHAKVREAVYRSLSMNLAKGLHHRVGELLSEMGDSAAEVAHHYHLSGDVAKTIEFGMIAADQAMAVSSYAEAVSSYTLVLEEAESEEGRTELRGKAYAGRAESLHEQGLNQKAIEDCKRALLLAKEPSIRLKALRVCSGSYLGMGHFTEAIELVRQAETEPGEERLEHLYLKEIEETITSRRTGYSATAEIVRELSRAYLEMGRRKDYAYSILSTVEHEMVDRPPSDFFRIVQEASGIFEELSDLRGQAFASGVVAEFYFIKGDVVLSAENYSKSATINKKLGFYSSILWDTWYWAMLYENAGEYSDAIRVALDGLEAAAIAEAPYPESGVYATLARCYLRVNKAEDAKKALVRMNELYERHSKDASAGLQGLVERARALSLEFEGRTRQADQAYARAIDLLKRFGMWVHEAEARREYGERLLEQQRWSEARGQLETALGLYESGENVPGAERARKALEALESTSA